MACINTITLLGNVTRDIDVRYTPSGKPVCDIGLALNENKDSVTFVTVTAWDKTAELAGDYVKKGDQLGIVGRLKMDEWKDRETGEKRTKLGVVADKLCFVGGGGRRAAQSSPAPQNQSKISDGCIEAADDVPF